VPSQRVGRPLQSAQVHRASGSCHRQAWRPRSWLRHLRVVLQHSCAPLGISPGSRSGLSASPSNNRNDPTAQEAPLGSSRRPAQGSMSMRTSVVTRDLRRVRMLPGGQSVRVVLASPVDSGGRAPKAECPRRRHRRHGSRSRRYGCCCRRPPTRSWQVIGHLCRRLAGARRREVVGFSGVPHRQLEQITAPHGVMPESRRQALPRIASGIASVRCRPPG
jgi:hypothetical protein